MGNKNNKEPWNGRIDRVLLQRTREFARNDRRTVTSVIEIALEKFLKTKSKSV